MRYPLKQKRDSLFLALLLVATAYLAIELRVETSMARLLPPTTRELSELAQDVIDSTAGRTMVLSIGPDSNVTDEDREKVSGAALKVATQMTRTLAQNAEVSWIRNGPEPSFERAVWDTYFPRRFNFVAADPETLEQRLTLEGLARSAEELKRQLGGAGGSLVRRFASRDPLLLFSEQVERLGELQPEGLSSVDGQFLSSDGHAIIFLGLAHSALDGTVQERLLASIDQAFTKHRGTHDELVLERSGINLFAVDSERRIKSDISRVAVLSTLGILCLFLVLFRSVTSLLVGFLPLISGFLAALVACMLLFGQVHALTLAFGASLLGVCIDYPVHLMNHRGLAEPNERLPVGVRNGLRLGALTTAVGISMLGFTGFSVMQQVAVFSAVGLLTAVTVTLLILPAWVRPGRVALRRLLAERLVRLVSSLDNRRRWLLGLCSLPLLLGAVGLSRASWASNLEGLAPLDPVLRAEDGRVRARVGAPSTNEMVLSIGSNEEQALERNGTAFRVLQRAQQEGLIQGFRSLHALLWSRAWQRENFERVTTEKVARDVSAGLSKAGFRLEGFRDFFEDQASARFNGLTLAELRHSPLGPLAETFVVQNNERTTILSFPRLVLGGNPKALARHLDGITGVHFIDQRLLLDTAYAELRQRVSLLILAGAACMFTIVFLHFRRVRSSLATLLPACVAPTAALGMLGLIGVSLNLFHLFAALVVLSMAMDYGIFLSQSLKSGPHLLAASGTLLSIVVAALTTCLSFGLLGFSNVPALAAIGQTVGIGIVTALLISPMTLLLQRRQAPAKQGRR